MKRSELLSAGGALVAVSMGGPSLAGSLTKPSLETLQSLSLPELMKRVGLRAARYPDGRIVLADARDQLFGEHIRLRHHGSPKPKIDEECDPGDCVPGEGGSSFGYSAGLSDFVVTIPNNQNPGGAFDTSWEGGLFLEIQVPASNSPTFYPRTYTPANCFTQMGTLAAGAANIASNIAKNPGGYGAAIYNSAVAVIDEYGGNIPIFAAVEFIGLVLGALTLSEALFLVAAAFGSAVLLYALLKCFGEVG
jgi:hypothetical protein